MFKCATRFIDACRRRRRRATTRFEAHGVNSGPGGSIVVVCVLLFFLKNTENGTMSAIPIDVKNNIYVDWTCACDDIVSRLQGSLRHDQQVCPSIDRCVDFRADVIDHLFFVAAFISRCQNCSRNARNGRKSNNKRRHRRSWRHRARPTNRANQCAKSCRSISTAASF